MIRRIEAALEQQAEALREQIRACEGTPLERELRTALALLHATIEELDQARRLEDPRPLIAHAH
jgi:hypothetical protein